MDFWPRWTGVSSNDPSTDVRGFARLTEERFSTTQRRPLAAAIESESPVPNMSNTPGNGAQPGAAPAAADPEVLKKLAALRAQMRESFGGIVMAMMALPRYRDQTLGDLKQLVLEPLVRDRLVTAQASGGGRKTSSGVQGTDAAPERGGEVVGIALWASVSEEVDLSIRRQIREGVFPIRLQAGDWTSGTINWLLDVIAADKATTAQVIANFRQVVKGGDLRLHPLIGRLVDPEALTAMGIGRPAGQGAGQG